MDKLSLLQRHFGYSEFRPGQEALIDGVLSGRDVLGIMPTGGGKSMCYQLPAMLLPGITLVVSPLISLMLDQVLALKSVGVPAAFLNSTLTGPQVQAVYRNLLAGKYKIVYVAPERLDYPGFGSVAARLPIDFVAVDEAHCISQWGQDFRPSYLRIMNFVSSLPRRPVVGAYTATATEQVRKDIARILQLQNPVQAVTGFDRPNLYFEVCSPELKERELKNLLSSRKGKSGIIYCSTRKKVDSIYEKVKDWGYTAARYHAGMEEGERKRSQEDFLYDRVTVMVATNAFGMGIDKSNVSFVIHYNMPKSMEAYYQEAGRAGRDGSDADCILLYSGSDVHMARYLIENGTENEDLSDADRVRIRQQDLKRLDQMALYCRTTFCLRSYILEYFGQAHSDLCGNCSNCRGIFENVDVTREAQIVLSCVARIRDALGFGVGLRLLGNILRGTPNKQVKDLGLDGLSTYGLLKEKGRSQVHSLINHLEAEGYLKTDPEHLTLELTKAADEVLYRGRQVSMRIQKEDNTDASALGLEEKQFDLFDALKELRGQIAKRSGIPAYVVFSNATLTDMAKKKPANRTEFKRISGVGELKAQWYAEEFLEVIRKYREQQA